MSSRKGFHIFTQPYEVRGEDMFDPFYDGDGEVLAPPASRDRVLALRAEPPAASHRFALRPTGAGRR